MRRAVQIGRTEGEQQEAWRAAEGVLEALMAGIFIFTSEHVQGMLSESQKGKEKDREIEKRVNVQGDADCQGRGRAAGGLAGR